MYVVLTSSAPCAQVRHAVPVQHPGDSDRCAHATSQFACLRVSNAPLLSADLVFAIQSDVIQALRLAVTCLAGGGFQKCVCAISGLLEPHWRRVSTDPTERCESGDPISLIMGKIMCNSLSKDLLRWHCIDLRADPGYCFHLQVGGGQDTGGHTQHLVRQPAEAHQHFRIQAVWQP